MSILPNKVLILFSLMVLFSLFSNAKSENAEEKREQSASEESEMEMEKRAIDKMRYYGGLGKRFDDNSYETMDYGDDEVELDKRLDRMRYFGALGKRSGELASNKLKTMKRLDKMKYFGGLGKRSDYYPMWRNSQLRYLLAKKSNFDRLRYLGNIGK